MPEFLARSVGVALDMYGCPNRCRHCYLGSHPNARMTEDDLRWVASHFKGFIRDGEDAPFFNTVKVSSWLREPDFSDNYKHLAQVEAELNGGKPNRYELLSIWRLARDPEYAEWAKSVGPDTCQITFFGMEETQDWFYRRKGAFQDCIKATERLLEVGMKPRWQFFLTKKLLPDVDELMRLIDRIKIRERVQELGSEFTMFVHAPGLDGAPDNLYDQLVTLEDTRLIPDDLVKATRKHFNTDSIWKTEAQTVYEITRMPEDGVGDIYTPSEQWFFVMANWDIYSNAGVIKPWWKLGNLKTDPLDKIIRKFETDRSLAMRLIRSTGLKELATRYGDPSSTRVVNDIACYWREQYCETIYQCIVAEDLYGVLCA